eukprot:scaffold5588_cov364-Prasinococcus_capsulatus_cf.AAC.3
MESLRELAMNRTCIFIAHRLSTIMHCDRIYVMKDGKVVECGTHAELTKEQGIYYNMWKLQQQEDFAHRTSRESRDAVDAVGSDSISVSR